MLPPESASIADEIFQIGRCSDIDLFAVAVSMVSRKDLIVICH
jgi:phosphoribosyl-dephospho-CoA transferase